VRITTPTADARIDLSGIDLFDATLYTSGDAHLAWQTLRAQAPVFWNPRPTGPGFWAVTRRADVRRVLRDHEEFTSERGTVLWMLGIPDPASGKMMAVTDPPRHKQIRAPLSRPLAQQAMPSYADGIRRVVREIVAPAWDSEEWDAAGAFARLPVASIALLMGLPDEDIERLLLWTYASIAPLDPHFSRGPMNATLLWAHHEIMDYFAHRVRERRAEPAPDLLSHLLTIEVRGRQLADDEVLVNCYSLLLGAAVTTSQAITASLIGLAEQGGGVGRWSPETDIAGAVEESLRWSSPTMHFMRYAQRDVVLNDVKISEGDAVAAWIASANRDETVFDRPYVFDPTRTPNRHIAFGNGPHRCVGQNLARLTLRVVFEEFFSKLATFELAAPPVHLVSNAAGGVVSAPMRLTFHPTARPPVPPRV
jgi:cytochrome P450